VKQMTLEHITETQTAFANQPAAGARVFRAPGRVNLIGEHTDYNDGFVMPVAIDFTTTVIVSSRADRKVSVFSENFGEAVEFDLDDPKPRAAGHWSDYVRGVAVVLEQSGHRLQGANLMIHGEVPLGSGLSSSAAIEVATAYALLANSGHSVELVELAKFCQRAENEFVGMRCGIMDQFISCAGQAGKALMLDCRSLEYKLLPLPSEARLVISNTMVKHALAGSEYNARRMECEAGVHHFAQSRPNVRALRDVDAAELQRAREDLSDRIHRRCRHVISENARVLEAARALESGDLETFGHLMYESHRSLRDDYEVSCRELDLMVELAAPVEGVYGARMTGGGFGGCTVSLVKEENVEEFKRVVTRGYEQATGLVPEIYVCSAGDGAGEIIVDCQLPNAD
jgi:galactokinase